MHLLEMLYCEMYIVTELGSHPLCNPPIYKAYSGGVGATFGN